MIRLAGFEATADSYIVQAYLLASLGAVAIGTDVTDVQHHSRGCRLGCFKPGIVCGLSDQDTCASTV
jgi:hypothetical protein